MATFAAIDFETARKDRNSACAVGLSIVDDNEHALQRSWLIRPPDNRYDDFNIEIHGIRPADTAGAPNFDQVWPEVADLIGDRLVVAHNTSFDMYVLQHASAHWDYTPPDLKFACTYRLAKDTWPQRWSHRLDHLAEDFDIDLDHHNALSDASAAAQVALHICHHHNTETVEDVGAALGYRLGELTSTGYSAFSNANPDDYLDKYQPKADRRTLEASDETDDGHPLFQAKIAFTGTLEPLTRTEAVQAIVDIGAEAQSGVTKKIEPATEETSGAVPTLDELVMAWGDGLLEQMQRKGRARFSAGRFIAVEDGTAVMGLPNEPHRKRCEDLRGELEVVLAARFGATVPFRLVVDVRFDG